MFYDEMMERDLKAPDVWDGLNDAYISQDDEFIMGADEYADYIYQQPQTFAREGPTENLQL